MPEALKVDWEAIRQDRLSGMKYTELGNKYGISPDAIAQRASRYGWKSSTALAEKLAKAQLKHVANAHVATTLKDLTPTLNRVAQEWIEKVKEAADKAVGQVSRKLDEPNLAPEDLVRLANALDRGDQVGRRALRLDAPEATNAGRPLVSMHFGEGSLSIVLGDAHAPLDSGPVIDVDSSDNQGPETT